MPKPTNLAHARTNLRCHRNPGDACDYAWQRLNVVIEMLDDHECDEHNKADHEKAHSMDLWAAKDLLSSLRDELYLTIEADAENHQKLRQNAGVSGEPAPLLGGAR